MGTECSWFLCSTHSCRVHQTGAGKRRRRRCRHCRRRRPAAPPLLLRVAAAADWASSTAPAPVCRRCGPRPPRTATRRGSTWAHPRSRHAAGLRARESTSARPWSLGLAGLSQGPPELAHGASGPRPGSASSSSMEPRERNRGERERDGEKNWDHDV